MAKAASAAHRHLQTQDTHRRDRHLVERPALTSEAEQLLLPGASTEVAEGGPDARVVEVASVGEHPQHPQVARRKPPVGHPKPRDTPPTYLLELIPRPRDVDPEGLGADVPDVAM